MRCSSCSQELTEAYPFKLNSHTLTCSYKQGPFSEVTCEIKPRALVCTNCGTLTVTLTPGQLSQFNKIREAFNNNELSLI